MARPSLRPEILAQLARLGAGLPSSTPASARASVAGGGGNPFSGAGAPETFEEDETYEPFPLPMLVGGSAGKAGAVSERAAILEHDGGWPRLEAEHIALREIEMLARGAGPAEWADLDSELIRREAARTETLDPSLGGMGRPYG